jgi:hypothetical protein
LCELLGHLIGLEAGEGAEGADVRQCRIGTRWPSVLADWVRSMRWPGGGWGGRQRGHEGILTEWVLGGGNSVR